MTWFLALLMLTFASAAVAQPVETQTEALTEDAVQDAARFGVSPDEALRRLRAQQSSVAATDLIRREFASRLAGISVEHKPEYRIVVLLTGNETVIDQLYSGVPVVFRTGAKVTREQAIAAMRRHLIDLRSELPGARGAGYDQRTGEVVLLVPNADAQRYGLDSIRARAEQLSGVPVRVVINDLLEQNLGMAGGVNVVGINTADGKRYRCTAGFVVTDGTRQRDRDRRPLPGRADI